MSRSHCEIVQVHRADDIKSTVLRDRADRGLVRKSRERVDLLSREGNRFNVSFSDIVDAIAAVPGDFVWDAELAVGSARGKDAFTSLHRRAKTTSPRSVPSAARRCPARLYVFDMLGSGARDLRGLALTGAQALAEGRLRRHPGARLLDGRGRRWRAGVRTGATSRLRGNGREAQGVDLRTWPLA